MGVTHTFVSIERDEYHKLYDYVTEKRLRVKNIEDKDAEWREKIDDIWSSSDESHDAYLDKVKAEGRERTAEASAAAGAGTFAGADFSDDDEDDEDFNPPEMNSSESEIAEEYDSNAQSSSESNSSTSVSPTGSSSPAPRQKKAKKSAPVPRHFEKKERKKAKKDPNAPTRPPTAYLLWFNEHRQEIKSSLGGSVGVTDVAKAAGEKWKTLDSEEKMRYQARADKLRESYERDLKNYKEKVASGGVESPIRNKISPLKSYKKAVAGTSLQSSGSFKSAEYVSESESSDSSIAGRAEHGGANESMSDLSE